MPEALLFLNQHEAATLDMLAGHIVPGDADDPGAREAGAVTYVDRALAGFLRELQTFYREGLRASPVATTGVVEAERRTKDAGEIARIERAGEIASAALADILHELAKLAR